MPSKVTPIAHTQSRDSYPDAWGDKYSEQDQADVCAIIDWINEGQEHSPGYENQRSQTKLGLMAGLSQSAMSAILQGKYVSPPSKHLKKMLDAMRRFNQRESEGVLDCPFTQTSVYQTVTAACKRAHLYRNFAVVSAFVGTGKTRCLKHYAANNSNVYLIEATPDMNAPVLVSELVQLTGAVVHKTNKYSSGTKAEKMVAIIRALKGTDSLIILDEAETVSTATLEYIRRISDTARVGVVLAGTQRLQPLIKDPEGRFGQISSRVGFWPPIIKGIREEDAYALTRAAFGDQVDVSPEVHDALWQMCDGSARVLVEALIPGVKDYGLRKGKELTPDLVFHVANQLLGLNISRRRGIR